MSTDLERAVLSGPTMGTRWSAELGVPAGSDLAALEAALAAAVAQVDAQMSTWKPESDLMRLNAAPVGEWVSIPPELMTVLLRGLEIGRLSHGAFDIGLGDLVRAWGFNARPPDEAAIRAALGRPRKPAHERLELDPAGLRARRLEAITLDLSGIGKGYGVDRMMQVCEDFAIPSALVALDGELRARGRQPDGRPWAVAVEKPDHGERGATLAIVELRDAAIATSGDYRHWVRVGRARLSHTMDRHKGGPVQPGIASVSVVAADCMTADAMATAMMVLGRQKGIDLANMLKVDCLILKRGAGGITRHGTGPIFGDACSPGGSADE